MELEAFRPPPGEEIPNHPELPVLVYRGVDGVADGPGAAKALFGRNGWGGSWINGVFDFHHFHSTAHEVLAIVGGRACLALGGPQGESFDVRAGDVLVLPAGTGHMRIHAADGFTVVGAYPPGQEDYDVLRTADDAARERIAAVPLPERDPVGGEGVGRWHASGVGSGAR